MRYAPRALWLAAPALLAGSLLASCSSNPEKATTTEKTAVVVPAEANSASDSSAVTADSAAAPK
jgi:hypothetical protein